jgi:putative transposase
MDYSNEFGRKSIRLKHYDYRSNGYYFVTICTYEKICYFGNIENQRVNLSSLGKIAKKFWLEIPEHFNSVEIDHFVIMPNHIHGIVVINREFENYPKNMVGKLHEYSPQQNEYDLPKIMSDLSPKKGSLSSIIRSYKSAVTRWNKLNNYDNFRWQSRFYEHIIRDDESLNNIREYIINNPIK